ncbi:stage V sporulation protein D [Desulfonispora thiosulfatigenes]|nr:stage V sporulation protein D [Desulfonispora thiosulfatigenes]
MKKRIGFVFLCTAVLISLLVIRVFWVQFIQGEELQGKAINNRLRDIEVKAKRGVIYDSNGSPLAISVSTGSIYAVPAQLKDKDKLEETATKLSEILEMDKNKVEEKLKKNVAFEWIKRRVPDEKIKELKELKLKGVSFVEENQRYYPKGKLAAHVLGFAGIDNQGLNGLELSYDSVLRGVSGKIMIEYDALNREIPNALHQYVMPRDGHSLYLTIDETIQYIVERELDNVIKLKQAKAAAIIVMDIKTGSILAMANRPVFDPNNYADFDNSSWRNFAISDAYEPGSTFKPVTAAAVLEEKVVKKNDRFYCPGYIKVGKDKIKCWKHQGHGSQDFVEGVQNSCNPVFVSSGLKLGKEDFYKYLLGFEFGKKTGIELPGEATGILVPKSRAKDIDLGSMSMGQANAVTPIQLVRAISAIANDGWLMKPRLVKEIRDYEGKLIKKIEPEPIQQVISKETSDELKEILESVVSEGTGSNAKIEGYKIAGKTGTAQKILPGGGYSRSEYIASFTGFAPANDPQIACLVVVDSPKGVYFGGQVAAPVFQGIVRDTLRYLNVPAEITKEEKKEEKVIIPDIKSLKMNAAIDKLKKAGLKYQKQGEGEEILLTLPPVGTQVNKGSNVLIYTKDKSSNMVVVPDLKDTTIREASSILSKLELKIAAQGSGLASLQEPLPGTKVEKGTTVTIRFTPLNQENVEETMGP